MAFGKDAKVGRKVALGATLAGIGGYLAGILTAPKSGRETREDIADKADEIGFETERQLRIAQNDLSVVIKDAQSKTVALSSQAREEFNEALLRAREASTKAKTLLKAAKDGKAEDPELNKAIKQAKSAAKNLGKFLKS